MMRTTSSKRIIQVGDIHLGLASNPAPYIMDNLRKYIHPLIAKKNIDAMIIAGDLFDHLLFFNDPYIDAIQLYAAELITLCHATSTELICLEGTPRHDRRQSQMLQTLSEVLGCNSKFKYITELSIEYNERLGKYILYVPDVSRDCAATVYDDITVMLRARGIDRVDLAIMHGSFDHQLPYQDKHTHSAEAFNQIVKDVILINHVHNFSHVGKIVAPGSFDCTEHGLSGTFGGVLVELSSSVKVSRIINKTPMPFVTHYVTDDNHKEIINSVDQLLGDSDSLANIRLKMHINAQNKALYVGLKKSYPYARWSVEALSTDTAEKEVIVPISTYVSTDVTQDNIISVVLDKLVRSRVEESMQQRAIKLLETYTHG